MKILYFCPHQLWPMNTGARLRNFHLSNALGVDYEVTLLQVLQPGEKKVEPGTATTYKRILTIEKDASYSAAKVMRGLLGPVPVTLLNYYSNDVARCLEAVLSDNDFDVVQIVSIHLFGYLANVRASSSRPTILLDWHNIESELMQRYAEAARNPAKKLVAMRTAGLLAQTELRALKDCDAHTVVSEREKEKLLRRYPDAKVDVVANGVDLEAYQFEPVPHTASKTLLFVGSMDYHANEEAVVWFVRDIWPAISQSNAPMRFTIAGRNPSLAVRALASDRVTVTGTVDDIRRYYQDAFAVVVPLRVGGGTRLKILEAMAAGVPVISTRLGSEGLDVQHGSQILFADSPEEMHLAVKRLLEDDTLRHGLRRAARQLVEDRYGWAALGKKMESIYLATRRTDEA